MSSTELTTYKTGGAPSDKSMHPGEYGRVSAWVKKTKNDLALVKDMYGHPPSIVFERPAEKLLKVATIDPPAGYAPPGDRQSYIEAADRTPSLKRTIDFSPPDTAAATGARSATNPATQSRWGNGAGIHPPQAPAARPEFITIANPDFIPTATMRKLKIWVHTPLDSDKSNPGTT
jgi:hypothetical protein